MAVVPHVEIVLNRTVTYETASVKSTERDWMIFSLISDPQGEEIRNAARVWEEEIESQMRPFWCYFPW